MKIKHPIELSYEDTLRRKVIPIFYLFIYLFIYLSIFMFWVSYCLKHSRKTFNLKNSLQFEYLNFR